MEQCRYTLTQLTRSLIVVCVGLFAACTSDGDPKEPDPPQPVGVMHSIMLVPGSAWDSSLTLAEQAAGPLVKHTNEINSRFESGELIANAFRGDGPGMYLYDDDAVEPAKLAASDPGIQDNILAVMTHERWTLLIEAMGTVLPEGDKTFVLEYSLGTAAIDAPLLGQDIASHSAYYGGLFAENRVLAGGVVADRSDMQGNLVPEPAAGSETRARYIVIAADKAAAEDIIASDPSVKDGTLSAKAVMWGNPEPFPTHFNRSSLAEARAKRE